MPNSKHSLELEILQQPDDTTCGPTCLHAVYGYYGDEVALGDLIAEVPVLETGGTLAVALAVHALRRGYRAEIYTYNLQLFDPTWFGDDAPDLAERLRAQRAVKDDPKLQAATDIYLEYLTLGGKIHFERLRPQLLVRHLQRGQPLLTGLSATYLYECSREHDDQYDDVRGEVAGHFVVLAGYDGVSRMVRVMDPLHDNPGFESHAYDIEAYHLIGAILLGIVTYDANLLVLEPIEEPG